MFSESNQLKDEFYFILTPDIDLLITYANAPISPATAPITTRIISKDGMEATMYWKNIPIPAPVSSIIGHIVPFSSGQVMVILISPLF